MILHHPSTGGETQTKQIRSGFCSCREAASTRANILPCRFIKKKKGITCTKCKNSISTFNEKYRECCTITFNQCIILTGIYLLFYWFKWSKCTVTKWNVSCSQIGISRGYQIDSEYTCLCTWEQRLRMAIWISSADFPPFR